MTRCMDGSGGSNLREKNVYAQTLKFARCDGGWTIDDGNGLQAQVLEDSRVSLADSHESIGSGP